MDEELKDKIHEVAKKYASKSNVDVNTIEQACNEIVQMQLDVYERNRLTQCDSLTKRQYELEQDFAIGFIEKHKRCPTFIDAIEYGIRYARNMMTLCAAVALAVADVVCLIFGFNGIAFVCGIASIITVMFYKSK